MKIERTTTNCFIGIYGYQNRRIYGDEVELLSGFDRYIYANAHRKMLKLYKRMSGD